MRLFGLITGFAIVLIVMIAQTGADAAALNSRVLTPDGSDTYSISQAAGTTTMTAPSTNAGSNLRMVFWTPGTAKSSSSQVSATWTSQSAASVQEGTAHNIVVTGNRVRAVTVTKNIWAQVYWVFNVHVWDSTQDPAFTQVAQFDMISVMFRPDGSYQPFPWSVRTQVQGTTIRFKIWFPAIMPEPAWSDPAYARSATFPAAWAVPGYAGGYVGHIPPSCSASYAGLTVRGLR